MSKTVLLDCDGVLADFEQQLINRLLLQTGDPVSLSAAVALEKRTGWDFKEYMTKPEIHVTYETLKTPGFARDMSLIPGAAEMVAALKLSGHHFVCVSSPWISNPTWEYDRRAWLKGELGIGHGDFDSTSGKYRVGGAVLIDDKPDTVEEWNKHHGGRGLLFDQFYNQDADLNRVGKMGTWSPGSIQVLLHHLEGGP